MPAARYWRAVGFDTHGRGELEVSEFHLIDAGGRIESLATLTSSHPPTSGALANLSDNNLGTTCTWARAAYISPGFTLQWDFGVGGPKDVIAIDLGSGASKAVSLSRLMLQYSNDLQTWATASGELNQFPYPGANQLVSTVLTSAAPVFWNPLDKGGVVALSNSNRTGGFSALQSARANLYREASVLQFEVTVGNAILLVGIARASASVSGYPGFDAGGWGYYGLSALKYHAGASQSYGSSYTSGNVIGVVVDFNAGTLTFYKNGVSQGIAFTGITGSVAPMAGSGSSGGTVYSATINGGETAFAYPVAGAAPWSNARVFGVPLQVPSIATQAMPFGPFYRESLGTVVTKRIAPVSRARDTEFSGRGTISGTVKIDSTPDIPVRRRVRLYCSRDGSLVRETWSDPVTGAYAFTEISERYKYTVVTDDYTLDKRAVIADNLMPEVT